MRRPVSPESYPLFATMFAQLNSELGYAGKVFNMRDLGVSIVRLAQLSSDILLQGRPIDLVTEHIETASKPLEVGLGRLAVYGKKYAGQCGQRKPISANLVIELQDDGVLADEFHRYEKEYANDGMHLQVHSRAEIGYSPHCSIAVIRSNFDYLDNQYSLNRLSQAVHLGSHQMSIKLDPVRRYTKAPDPLTSTYSPLDAASNGLVGCCSRQTEATTPAVASV